MNPFFSIIVVTYNAGPRLAMTVNSILGQTCGSFEVLVKDGGSADGSLQQCPEDPRIRIFAGKDRGIYDAMNFAVRRAEGEFLYFLNTGDRLADAGVLEKVRREILRQGGCGKTGCGGQTPMRRFILYGDVLERRSGQVAAAKPEMDDFALFRNVPCHQACFYSRDLFAERGFDTGLTVRADYEHFLWCHYRAGARMVYFPETIAEKKDLVLSHQLALWDTVAQCSITGSSDASIRDIVPVDILRIVQPAAIHTVLCNGRLSGTLYQRYLEPVTGIAAHIMPSTSPANAAFSLEKLVECWRPLLLSCSSENGI